MQIERAVDLQPHHTFGLPVRAAAWTELTNAARLPEITALPEYDPDTVLWLGGGSNVLFGGDYPGLVVHLANRGIAAVPRGDGRVAVTAQAGEIWHDFVQHTVAQGWYGLENLSLIPGTVGAAPVQNIGAYGVEAGEYIDSVYCYDLRAQTFVTLPAAVCRFAYRDSLFKQEGRGRYVICAVTFVLDTVFAPRLAYGDVAAVAADIAAGGEITAADVAAAVCRIRRSKLPDPAVLGNAGSFFKNPVVDAGTAAALLAQYPTLPHYPQADGRVKLAAGWLIDRCGLKGFAVGGAAVHDRQALVLVNRGGATAADVIALERAVQARVAEAFGVALTPEPVWLAR